jgi:hypothetical protein
LRAKEKRKLKACELVTMKISYALSHWYYWKVGSRRSKQVIFRFSLSEHTHSTPHFTPRRGGEGEPESRCQFLELCFRNYSHPVGLGLSRTKLNRPNSQIPNPCTGTPRTRTASAPSHDELTSQQGRSGELSPARPSRRRRRRVSPRMRGRLGPGRTGGRQGTVWRFGGRVGLAMPAAIIWQVDLSVVSHPMIYVTRTAATACLAAWNKSRRRARDMERKRPSRRTRGGCDR